MTVMGPATPTILPGTSPSDICSDCGKPQDDPVHIGKPHGPAGDIPSDEPPEDPPTGDDKPGDKPGDDKGNGQPSDDDDEDSDDEDGDDDEDDDGTDGDGDDDDDEPTDDGTDETGDDDEPGQPKGKGGDEPKQPKDDDGPIDLPDEMTVGAGRGAPVVITEKDRTALQKAVDEDALLEGDPTHGRGQILRDPTLIRGFRRREWQATAALGAATSAIRGAFMKSKSGVEDFEGGQRHGKLSGHDLHKVAIKGESRLFGKRTSPDVARYNLWVLVDCSISMAGREIQEASAVAQAFASATAAIGTIRCSVWGWTDPFASDRSLQVSPDFGAVRVYTRGDDPSRCRDLNSLPMGGTPDHSTMAWAVEAIRRDSAPGEQPIIAFVSDGMGYQTAMSAIVKDGRKHGVIILGVNIQSGRPYDGGPINDPVYGADYIPWMGGIVQMAGPLARTIARIITPKATR